MTNTEKNRLIEAFMGWELKFVTDYDINQWCFVNKHTSKTISGMHNDSELPYCTDWNLLMEALYQFDMLKLSIPEKRQGEFNDFNSDIKSYVISYNTNDAVNALCEGIEWYNSTLN